MSHWHVVASLPHVTRLMSYCVRAGAAMSLVAALLAPLVIPQKVYAGEPFTIETIAGTGGVSGYSGDGGPATDATLNTPAGIAYDASGNLLIADWSNNCVRMVPATSGTFYGQSMTAGYIYTIAGNGTGGYSGDGGTGTEATLHFPQGVAFDSSGNAYIADSRNYCIRRVDEATGIITTVAGIGTSFGATGDGGPATAAKLNLPTGVAFDASGNLYIADSYNHRVRMVAAEDGTFYDQAMTAGYIYTIAGTGVSGYSGDGGSPTSATLTQPYATHIDAAGNLYIADTLNHRVRMIPATTETYFDVSMTAGNIYTVAGTGSAGFSGDGGPAVSAELCWPSNMVIDSAGRMFIADRVNHRVRAVDPDGVISTFAGTGGAGFSGNGGPATEATLGLVYGATLNMRGDVFISDSDNDCIRVVYAEVNPWITFLGADNNDEACGIATDSNGNVYVTGTTNLNWVEDNPKRGYAGSCDAFVAKLGPTGTITWYTFLGQTYSDYGGGIAIDGDGDVYVTGYSDDTWGESPRRTYSSSFDAFVAKLDGKDGTLLWNTFLGAGNNDMGFDIDVDEIENVYVTGISWSDWAEDDATRAPSGGADVFVAELDATGDLNWYGFLGGSGDECSNYDGGIALDGDGYVYVTSSGASSWSEAAVVEHSGGSDAFVARLTSGGALDWHTFLGSAESDSGNDIAVDNSGNTFVTGSSAVSWGTTPRLEHGGGLSDAFVASLSADGSLAWHTFLGGSGDEAGNGVALDASGNIYVGGSGWGTWGNPEVDYAGNWDMVAAKLSPNGALIWHSFAGSVAYELGLAVDVGADGLVLVAGVGAATWGDPVRAYSYYNDGLVVQLVVPTSTLVDVDIELAAGWNMVSVPVVPADAAVETVFWDSVVVYTWDAEEGVYIQVHEGGDLTDIEPGRGYWVKVTDEHDGTLTVTGVPVDSPTTYEVDLSAGWNMVGSVFHSTSLLPMSFFVAGDPESDPLQRDAIYYWAASEKEFFPVGQYDPIEPGVGYWLASATDCTITMVPPPV